MTDKQTAIIASVLGNCFLFGLFIYVVFWLGASGWWMLFPALIHFSVKDWNECKCKKEEETDEEEYLG